MSDQQPRRPVDWDELYPGRFMKAGQLGDGKHVFTIQDVTLETLEGDRGQKDKGVITFKETQFQWALNKTNGEVLKALFGRKVQDWIGKQIALYRGEVESGSKRGEPAIRVYGCPHLKQDMHITIQLPKKKPFQVTVHAPRQQRQEQGNDGNRNG